MMTDGPSVMVLDFLISASGQPAAAAGWQGILVPCSANTPMHKPQVQRCMQTNARPIIAAVMLSLCLDAHHGDADMHMLPCTAADLSSI
jgi:hypothetical protein